MSCKDTGMCKTAAICFLAGCQDEAAASPVQGAASAPICPDCNGARGHEKELSSTSGTWIPCPTCCPSEAATSSASGAKGAAEPDYCPACELPADAFKNCGAPNCAVRDYGPGDARARLAALADRSPAVQPSGTVQALVVGVTPGMGRIEIEFGGDVPEWADLGLRIRIATPAPEQEAAPADLRKAAQSVVASFQDQHVSLAALQRQVNMLADALAAPVPATTPAEQTEGEPALTDILNCYSPDDTVGDYQDKIRALFAAPARQEASQPEQIPGGISYSGILDNFYSIEAGQGQGGDFYEKWIARRAEFPQAGANDFTFGPVAQEAGQPEPKAERECTCPSGNGSLAWPCPQHPPEGVDVMRRFVAPASQHSAPGGALHDALMRCCLELPAGCEVRVCVERDSGWVEFSHVDGETHHVFGEGYLSDDVMEALEAVQAEASASPVPRAQGGITNDESSGKGCATATNTNQPENFGAANTNKGGE